MEKVAGGMLVVCLIGVSGLEWIGVVVEDIPFCRFEKGCFFFFEGFSG